MLQILPLSMAKWPQILPKIGRDTFCRQQETGPLGALKNEYAIRRQEVFNHCPPPGLRHTVPRAICGLLFT